ncbi:MAG: apolipoprotein N-acyltransferase [Planctomycetes bacterium]|nr:apolipoprotein N-acyltransferase [Planctomycetota bacterium]
MLPPLPFEKLSGRPRQLAWAAALISAPLVALSQPPADLPLLGLLGFAPLFLALPRLSPGGGFLAAFSVGVAHFAVNVWWLGQMVTDPGNEWAIFAMFCLMCVVMGSFYGVAGLVTRWLLTRQAAWTAWLVPFVWLACEFAHEYEVPATFPWLPMGSSLLEFQHLVQTADLWGAHGLTLLAAFVNLAVAAPFELAGPGVRLRRRAAGVARFAMPALALLLLVGGTLYGVLRVRQLEAGLAPQRPVIASVQGNLTQEVKVRNDPQRVPRSFQEHLQLSESTLQAQPHLVCWAETMLFGGCTREGLDRYNPAESAPWFKDGVPSELLLQPAFYTLSGRRHDTTFVEHLRARIAHEYQVPMLVGAITSVPAHERVEAWKNYDARYCNSAVLFDAQGKVSATYEKRYLVPGGEYIPWEGNPAIRAIVEGYSQGLQGYTSRVEPGVQRTLFRAPGGPGRDWAFTASICYEYAFPGCYLELHEGADPYPDFHVNISNEGWFKRSAELDHAMDFCRLRCIESRVPMARATNTGITACIDALGRVQERLVVNGQDREVQGVLVMRPAVLAEPKPTVYVAWVGRGPGWLSLAVTGGIMALMAVGRWTERRKRRKAEAKA